MTEVCTIRRLELESTHAAQQVAAPDRAIEYPLRVALYLQCSESSSVSL